MSVISEKSLSDWIQLNKLCVVYFKTQHCGVCHAMLPKIEELISELNIPIKIIDLSSNLHLASSQMVLNVPITKVFVAGKEAWKEGAYQDLNKLRIFLQKTIEAKSIYE